jgi:hypothetical protein
MDIKAKLKTTFYGVRCKYSPRPLRDITCLVVHQAQASSAESTARFLHTRPDGSAHAAVDAKEGYLLADMKTPTCGVKDVNHWTWHIEQAGFSSWIRSFWLSPTNRRMMKRCAYQVAIRLHRLGLPNRFLTTRRINAGARRGWTTHAELSRSRVSSSVHTDPGLGFPRRYFGLLVRSYLKEFARPKKAASKPPAPTVLPIPESMLTVLAVPEPSAPESPPVLVEPILAPMPPTPAPVEEPPCDCGGPEARPSLLSRIVGLFLRAFLGK